MILNEITTRVYVRAVRVLGTVVDVLHGHISLPL